MISIKNRRIFLTVATLIMFAVPAIGYAAWCTGSDLGKFNYGAGCVAPPDPNATLNTLIFGNQSSATGNVKHLKSLSTPTERTDQYNNGQKPSAIVLTCSDSRLPPEIIFNRALGEIFTVRVAGNIVAEHEIGSIEYAIEHLGANLIVVLGHERCGAVQATFDVHGSPSATAALGPNLGSLVTSIDPAVTAVLALDSGAKATSATGLAAQVEACVVENTRMVTDSLETKSAIIKEFVESGRVKIIQGKYDLDGGLVAFSTAPTPNHFILPATSNTGNITLNWSQVIPNAEYVVEQQKDGASWVEIYKGTDSTLSPSGLAVGSYVYRVKASKSGYNEGGYRNSSACVVTLVPTAPDSLAVPKSSNSGNIFVSWSKIAIIGATYDLEVDSGLGFVAVPGFTGITDTFANITGLADKTYSYRVRANIGVSTSAWKVSANPCVVNRLTAPGRLSSVAVPDASSTGNITVYWPKSELADVAGNTVQYTVKYSFNGGSQITLTTLTTDTSVSTAAPLADGVYVFYVTATIDGGLNYSLEQSSITCVVGRITTPGKLSSVAVPASSDNGSITVFWPKSELSGVIGNTTQYHVEYTINGLPARTILAASTAVTSVSATGLVDGDYVFYVKAAINGTALYGPEQSSKTCTVTLKCDTPFNIIVPDVVTSTANIANFIVYWPKVTNVLSGPVTYTLQRTDSADTGWIGTITTVYTGPDTLTPVTINAPPSKYLFRLKATATGYAGSAYTVSKVVEIK